MAVFMIKQKSVVGLDFGHMKYERKFVGNLQFNILPCGKFHYLKHRFHGSCVMFEIYV